jgi:hypothetical protein
MLAFGAGLRKAKQWNVSLDLSRTKGLAVFTKNGWELTTNGRNHVAKLIGAREDRIENVATSVRAQLTKVTSVDVKEFLEEAVSCFERGYHRAAIVLSWVGAVSVLQEHVVKRKLPEFNNEATRRTANTKNPWKAAVTTDDVGAMKEREFLEILVAVKVIGKNVKQQLQEALDLRNACGHPTSVKVAVNAAAAHLEKLLMNVFAKF